MRYRMLDVRIWCDQKFRALSALKPSGQALFLYLLSNPNTTSMPGLYRAGAAAMAEELNWSLIGFHRALREIVEQGLVKVDLKARVIFISNVIKYNKPQSPNVVRSWAVHWDEIPECSLKNEAYQALKIFVYGLGNAFAQAFDESLRKVYIKDKRYPTKKSFSNQEQEQEKEQEQEQEKNLYSRVEEVKEDKNSRMLLIQTKNKLSFYAGELDSTKLMNGIISSEFIVAIPLIDKDFYKVSRDEYIHWKKIYPAIDVLHELQQLVSWNTTNFNKRKSRSGILQHIHRWLIKAQQRVQFPLQKSHHYYPSTFNYNLTVAKNWIDSVFVGSEQYFEPRVLQDGKII